MGSPGIRQRIAEDAAGLVPGADSLRIGVGAGPVLPATEERALLEAVYGLSRSEGV